MSVKQVSEFWAQPGKENEMAQFLTSLVPYITAVAGNLGCDVMQSEEEPRHFMVIEHWESDEAQQKSVNQLPPNLLAHIQSFIDAAPSNSDAT